MNAPIRENFNIFYSWQKDRVQKYDPNFILLWMLNLLLKSDLLHCIL